MPKTELRGRLRLTEVTRWEKKGRSSMQRSVPWTPAKELPKYAPSDRADEARTFPPAKEPLPHSQFHPHNPRYLETGARARIRCRSHVGEKTSPLPTLTMRVRSARLARPAAAPACQTTFANIRL